MSTSDPDSLDGRGQPPVLEGGVLAGLPRTRPQRTSARRAAQRSKAGKPATSAPPKKTVASAAEGKASPVKAVKASAPRTRPGRAGTKPALPAKARASATSAKGKAASSGKTASSGKPTQPPAPRQGYEPEEEVELGNTVSPPSGVELVESVADIVGELANSGLAAGGRILKDAFSLLRRP
jgi:hypothetical protein